MTTVDMRPLVVEEAIKRGVNAATFLQEMYGRMAHEMEDLPTLVLNLVGEINRLRAENTKQLEENSVLKQRVTELESRSG